MKSWSTFGCVLVLGALVGCDNGAATDKGPAGGVAGSSASGGSVSGGSSGSSSTGGATATGGSASGGSANGGNGGMGGNGGTGGSSEPPFSTDNLLVNGDAEQGNTGWAAAGTESAFRPMKYGENGYPAATDPGPAQRGQSFFDGGESPRADSHQSVDVSAHAARIEKGLRARLSAYLGGYQNQNDAASVVLRFLAADGSLLSQSVLGGPYAAERLSTTGLLAYELDVVLPPLTHSIDVHVVVTRAGGTGNDGYADNLSLVLHN